MKRNRFLTYMMAAAAILPIASCSDFDDYNDGAMSDGNPLSGKTIWENISENEQLSDFKALVERTGFNEQLSQLNAYTVWAPLNGKFDVSTYRQMSDSVLLARFVKNHISKFDYRAVGDINERVQVLNGKSYTFEGNGTYVYDEVPLAPVASVPSSNGTLHFLNGAVQFYPNLYEYLSNVEDADSIVNYIKKYEVVELDRAESEKGPMVNGMQTYVDSVMKTSNTLTEKVLRANIENEDSSYTFLIPNNKAYADLYAKIRACYRYLAVTKMQDAASLASYGATTTGGDNTRNRTTLQTEEVNSAYLIDSVARRYIASGLIYSNNDSLNSWILNRTANESDTIRSTTRGKFSNPEELLNEYLIGEKVRMSNGYARIVDSLAFKAWELYNPEINVGSERNIINMFLAKATLETAHDTIAKKWLGPEAEEFRWTLIQPKDALFDLPKVFFKLPNLRATKYRVYCVVLPWEMGAKLESAPVPTPLNFDLSYCGANGNLANYHFAYDSKTGTVQTSNPATLNMNTVFLNDPEKVDTMYLGEIEIPVCYEGLEDKDGKEIYPSMYVSVPDALDPEDPKYSREIRIHSFIMRPVEKDEAEAEEKNQ